MNPLVTLHAIPAPALVAAVDALNARYGKDWVRYAASGTARPWKLRAEHLSQRYTTAMVNS